jgi:hypothetical protein
MGDFLTSASTLMCPHGGTVTAVPSNTKVTIGSNPIVLSTDTFTVAGCAFMIGPVPHPCLLVQWQLTALMSTCDSMKTLTKDSMGLCMAPDGAAQGPVQISATQAKASGN